MPKKKLSNKGLIPYFSLLLAIGIWGIATVIIKLTLEHIPLMSFLFYRFLIVGILMLPIVWIELKKTPISLKDLPTLIVLGLLGQSGILFIFAGISLTTAIDAAIISAVAPLIIIGLGHYYYKDTFNKKLEFGLIVATLGTLFVVLEPALTHTDGAESIALRIIGNLLVIFYNFVFALYIILSKKVMGEKSGNMSKTLKKLGIKPLKRSYSPLLHTSISFYVALVTFIPLFLLESFGVFGNYSFNITNLAPIGWVGLLYMAIVSSIVAYIAFQWGLDNARVSDSGVFAYLGPAFTLPAAFIILGEVPSVIAIVGSVIIAAGVVIAETRKS